MGLVLVILLAAGGLALDSTAISAQGQSLQSAADSAALAGVTEWAVSGDEAATNAVVAELMRQNGFASADGFSWNTEFVSPSEVRVLLTDDDPDVFLREAIGLGDIAISRFANANFTPCVPTCGSTVDVPEPLLAVNYNGSGDGYRPLLVEGKVYAVRHHDRVIGCVDRSTSLPCWPEKDRDLFPSGGKFTMNVTNPHLFGSRIYYLGFQAPWNQRGADFPSRGAPQQGGALYIGCWETKTDVSCGETFVTSNEGQGTLAGTDDGLFVFTNDRKVHCFTPGTMTACAGYGAGLTTAAAAATWDQDPISVRNSTFREHQGKIYTTLAYEGHHHIHCWDANSRLPCTGFGLTEVNDLDAGDSANDVWYEGRLFFSRLSDGTPHAICSTGRDGVDCLDFFGNADTAAEANLASFVTTWDLPTNKIQSSGQHTYHPASNRTFFLSQTSVNETYCWDWSTGGGSCGLLDNTDGAAIDPLPYGYWPTTECLFGLGHAKVFFTITPDLDNGCDRGNLLINVDPCDCQGALLWPEVNIRNDEEVEEFRVRVLNTAGAQIFPATTGEWLDLTDADAELTLADIATSTDQLTIEVVVVPTLGGDPWGDGEFPGLEIVSPGFLPHLVE